MRPAAWSPQSMSEAIRQGRPPRKASEPLLQKITGLDHKEARQLRRWWRRNHPEVLLVAVVVVAIAAAVLAVLVR